MAAFHRENIADIELQGGSIFREWAGYSIGLKDKAANRFGVRVFRDGEPVNLEGYTCEGFFQNSQKTNLDLSSYGTIEENVAYVTLPQACYDYEGQFTLAIKIVDENSTVTMRIVDGMVDNTYTGGAAAPTGSVPTYQEVLAVYDQMVAAKNGSVRFDITQELTEEQKAKARKNMDGADRRAVAAAVGNFEYIENTASGVNLYCDREIDVGSGEIAQVKLCGWSAQDADRVSITVYAHSANGYTALGSIGKTVEMPSGTYEFVVPFGTNGEAVTYDGLRVGFRSASGTSAGTAAALIGVKSNTCVNELRETVGEWIFSGLSSTKSVNVYPTVTAGAGERVFIRLISTNMTVTGSSLQGSDDRETWSTVKQLPLREAGDECVAEVGTAYSYLRVYFGAENSPESGSPYIATVAFAPVDGDSVFSTFCRNDIRMDAALKDLDVRTDEIVLCGEYGKKQLDIDKYESRGGGINVSNGKINYRDSDAFRYFIINTKLFDDPGVTVTTKVGTLQVYPKYVYATDDEENVLGSFIDKADGDRVVSKTEDITLPEGTTRMYILTQAASDEAAHTNVRVTAKSALLDYEPKGNPAVEALSDITLKNKSIAEATVNHMIAGGTRTVSDTESEVLAGTCNVINRHDRKHGQENPLIRFGMITDTHKGGERTLKYDPQYNIAAFVKVVKKCCDFAVHCGDVITNYEDETYMPDLDAVKAALRDAMNDYNGLRNANPALNRDFLIVKGNHDIGLNGYEEAEEPEWKEDTYYRQDPETGEYVLIRSEAEFDELVEQGAVFYEKTLYLLTNREYTELVLSTENDPIVKNNRLPASVVFDETADTDHYGGYYYYDFGGKVRVIVLNDEFVSSSEGVDTVGLTEAQQDFLESALAGAKTAGLHVITMAHKGFTGTKVRGLINAFINGGGTFIAHIHGHSHADTYSRSDGFNNIGVCRGFIEKNIEGSDGLRKLSHDGYCFSVFEIDTAEKRLYEIRTGFWIDIADGTGDKNDNFRRSEDRVWDYGKQKELV